MKPIWKILIVAGVIAGLVVGLFVIPHYRAQRAVAAYRELLKRQGEKMSIAELTPSVSAEEAKNGRELLAAGSMLGNLSDYPSSMRLLAPGHALVGWAEATSPTYDATNCWPEVIEIADKNQDRLAAVQAALAQPKFGFPTRYQDGFPVSLMYLATLKKTSIWLSTATAVALHEKDAGKAWTNLEAGSELIRKFGNEPLMINQLVRFAMMNIQLAQTWEALQYSGWSDPQLAQLQQTWDSFNLLEQLEPCLSLERVIGEMEVVRARNSYSNFADIANLPHWDNGTPRYDNFGQVLANPVDGIKAHLRYHAWKALGSYEEEVCAAQIWQAALEAVRIARTNDAFVPALNHFKEAATNILKTYPGSEQRFVFANGMADNTSRLLLKAADAETGRRMLVTVLALERYKLRHKAYPARLEELTPDYLSKVPIDFMDGKRLRYRRKEDGTFLLYSVGEDGKDDGGDGSPPPTYTLQSKIWYRMRDAVWPVPATADEVKKYEAEMFQKLKNKPPGGLVPQMKVPEPAATNSKTN